jgi:hypothetical protein
MRFPIDVYPDQLEAVYSSLIAITGEDPWDRAFARISQQLTTNPCRACGVAAHLGPLSFIPRPAEALWLNLIDGQFCPLERFTVTQIEGAAG